MYIEENYTQYDDSIGALDFQQDLVGWIIHIELKVLLLSMI